MQILMVCLGNICRSPLAEGIMQQKIMEAGLDWTVDSAGTGGWHAGDPPDGRSVVTGREMGIDISGQRARKFVLADFDQFDHILVMDSQNMTDVLRHARHDGDRGKVALIMNFVQPQRNVNVPDPYYGGSDGFHNVYRMLDSACGAFISIVNRTNLI